MYYKKELTPGELAPGLVLATDDTMADLLETGQHLDFTDFKNACTSLSVAQVNASRAFGTAARFLARDLYDQDLWRPFDDAMTWCGGNPNVAGVRRRLLLGTQNIADIVESHQAGTFTEPELFTPRMWRVIRATVWDEFSIEFVRQDRETSAFFTRTVPPSPRV